MMPAGNSLPYLVWKIFADWRTFCHGRGKLMSLCHWDVFLALTIAEPQGKVYTLHRKIKAIGFWNPSSAVVFWVCVLEWTPRWVWWPMYLLYMDRAPKIASGLKSCPTTYLQSQELHNALVFIRWSMSKLFVIGRCNQSSLCPRLSTPSLGL